LRKFRGIELKAGQDGAGRSMRKSGFSGVSLIVLAMLTPVTASAQGVPVPRPNPWHAPGTPVSDDAISALIGESAGQPLSYANEAPAAPPAPLMAPAGPPPVQIQTASAIEPPAPPAVVSIQRSIISEGAFKLAVRLFDTDNPNDALAAADALPDPVDAKIIKWLVAVYKSNNIPSSKLDEISRDLADWPGQTILRTRFEQAVEREKPGAEAVIRAFGGREPVSFDGTLLLARSYIATGQKAAAAAILRPQWRTEPLDDAFEAAIRKEFSGVLSKADHKARMDRMLYEEQSTRALRAAAALDANQQALAKAVIAVIKRDPKAGAALDGVPKALRKDPLYLYSRIQQLRRAEKIEAAAELMLSAPREADVLVDPDAWWVERRVLTRELMEKRDYRNAYRVAAAHAAESSSLRAEAEFHAGWLALEFLNDPNLAARHFAVIQTISKMPLSQSRAEYWLGRAAEAAGNRGEATRQYQLAAAYPTTFYGQLSLARLGAKSLPISAPPKPDAAAKKRFASLELVQVMQRLTEIKHDDRNTIFLRHLAETLTDPTQLALLTSMAKDDHNLALQLGKTAASRGIPVDTLAFPTSAIPKSAKTGSVDRAVVYAIARQESAFHPGAVSKAGARGLLQLMPATAKQMAKSAGVSYSQAKLTTDPAYNATLGAEFLGHLIDRYNGSYVMTFAAYNAGPSRVTEWVGIYGDPRDPKVDVVNWIESIPFTETRNYVQRIMENVQVYRARLGSPGLTIEKDLKRGG
jgi:soluble lytic murein transglycosylase